MTNKNNNNLPVLSDDIEKIITGTNGACDKLTEAQRIEYSNWLCNLAGIDPALHPIDFIPTSAGLRPYLNKGAAEIIREIRGISITSLDVTEQNGVYTVVCKVTDGAGRIDCDIGAWPKGKEPHNALMKAVTKAKRRATLSMCRLGGLIEETHPTEYDKEIEVVECKSRVLLEDELTAKNQFAAACQLKTGGPLTKEDLQHLLAEAQKTIGSPSIAACADWVKNAQLQIIHIDNKAEFKEATNAGQGYDRHIVPEHKAEE